MIICRTPFRISLFGGGTDYPDWYRENGGIVIASSINKYCYVSCRILPPFFDHKHRIIYSKIENINDVNDIQHPAVKAVLQTFPPTRGLEIHHDADLPAKSGLGSSSAFTVSLLNALHALHYKALPKKDLARLAIYIEQAVIQECVGCQDQIATAFGGLNKIIFHPDDSFIVEPLCLSPFRTQELEKHILLFYTGISRYASVIAQAQVDNMAHNEKELSEMSNITEQALNVLLDSNVPVAEIGRLLHESWLLKRSLSNKVSSPKIDQIYQEALNAGALGGKIIGAGGGGFLMLFVEPEKRPRVLSALHQLTPVQIRFEKNGSKIIFYDPDEDLEKETAESFMIGSASDNWFEK